MKPLLTSFATIALDRGCNPSVDQGDADIYRYADIHHKRLGASLTPQPAPSLCAREAGYMKPLLTSFATIALDRGCNPSVDHATAPFTQGSQGALSAVYLKPHITLPARGSGPRAGNSIYYKILTTPSPGFQGDNAPLAGCRGSAPAYLPSIAAPMMPASLPRVASSMRA